MINKEINSFKEKLIKQAKKKGISENFGQKEESELTQKYGYTKEVQDFYNWAMNFDLSQI